MKKCNVIITTLFIVLLASVTFNAECVEKINKNQKQIDTEFVYYLKDLETVINNKDIDSNEFLREMSLSSGRLSILVNKTSYVNRNPEVGTSMFFLVNLLDRPGIGRQCDNLRGLSKYIDNVLKSPADNKASVALLRYLKKVEEKLFQTQFGFK